MIQTKICGLSTPESVDAAIRHGASHVGFVFFAKSPRNVALEMARSLVERVGRQAKVVGLFVDPEPAFVDAVREQVTLDIIQLHGSERPALVGHIASRNGLETWKAIPVRTADDLREGSRFIGSAHRLLYDAKPPSDGALPGGTGRRFDWKLLDRYAHRMPWVLAGGLDARNLAEAVNLTKASTVDVSSGVEGAPGVKDVDRIAAFLHAARQL